MKSYQQERTLIPEGEYECLVQSCSVKESMSGKKYVEFDFFIRKDVEQKAQGRHIFKKFFEDENGVLPEKKIGKYAFALGIPKGQEFEPWELQGAYCLVNITHFDRDDGEKGDCVYFIEKSKLEEKPVDISGFEDVSVDDATFK